MSFQYNEGVLALKLWHIKNGIVTLKKEKKNNNSLSVYFV